MDRLYVSRKKGGRGLRSIADVVALGKASLAGYVENANEPILRKLKDEELVKYEKHALQEKKQHIFRERETRWKNKVLHGKWVEIINNTCAQTSEWLRNARLKPSTEALITAAQDQALNTNWHSCHILKTKQTMW